MGAYFRNYNRGDFIEKVLIKKFGGSPYPNFKDFSNKINLLKKYLGDFIADTEIYCDGKYIRIKQAKILGKDLFDYLDKYRHKKPKQLINLLKKLNNLYKKTGMLPDLINKRNILITKDKKIKIVDIWPLFFHKRVIEKDLNEESYKENLNQLKVLNNFK